MLLLSEAVIQRPGHQHRHDNADVIESSPVDAVHVELRDWVRPEAVFIRFVLTASDCPICDKEGVHYCISKDYEEERAEDTAENADALLDEI